MKRLGPNEKGVLALSIILIVVGAFGVIHPTEMVVPHPAEERRRGILKPSRPAEHLTESRARWYGAFSIAFGAALGGFVFYRPRG